MFVRSASLRIPPNDAFLPQPQVFGINEKTSVLLVEVRDLVTYLNAIVFVYRVIRDYDDAALNRPITHPMENLFGLVRLACHENHTWDSFRSAVAKDSLAGDFLAAHRLQQHIRRDLSIGVAKATDQRHFDDQLRVPNLLKHRMGHSLENVESVVRLWTQGLFSLAKWKNGKHFVKLYHPGPVANDAILSRIIGFGGDATSHKWVKSKRDLAFSLHDQHKMTNEEIAAQDKGIAGRRRAIEPLAGVLDWFDGTLRGPPV
jgi:hypothetical protein